MSYSPATPDKSFKDTSKYPTKIVIPNLEKQSTSKVKQASLNEPSPASTYGGTAAGDSVPVTPQEVNGKSSTAITLVELYSLSILKVSALHLHVTARALSRLCAHVVERPMLRCLEGSCT